MMYSPIESAPQRLRPGFAAEVHLRGCVAPLPHEVRQDGRTPLRPLA